MPITFQPINEKQIKSFFKQQKDANKRFRQGEFIEDAILEKINRNTNQKPKQNDKNN